MFGSAGNPRVDSALSELRARCAGDLLRLTPADLAATSLGLRDIRRLQQHLIAQAISDDSDRLIASAQTLGRQNVPPARLVSDWATRLGADTPLIHKVAAAAPGPVALAQAYLRTGRIEFAEATNLADIADAYGADRDLALVWIQTAIDREIDRCVAQQAAEGGLWQRLRRAIGLSLIDRATSR
jgi:hypothetical protein